MIKPLIAALLMTCLAPAFGGTYLDAANVCMADNTTGKDRKNLARWIFVAMAAHPEIHEVYAVPKETADQSARETGRLFTRLLTENCPKEIKVMIKNEGQQSLPQVFQILGQLAMQELMTSKDVTASISAFQQFVDTKKIAEVLDTR